MKKIKMSRSLFLIMVVALLLKITAYAQPLPPQRVTPGQWIKSWLLCGPIPVKQPLDASGSWDHLVGFNTDYLVHAGGEQNLRVKAGDVVHYGEGSVWWKLYHSSDSIIDLDKTLSNDDFVMAYAYTEVQSDENKVWFISLGTNDGGRLWVNGLNVWDYPQERGLFIDDDVIPVVLKKGINTLLLKVEERGNRWGFCVRFIPFSTAKLVEADLFNITTDENGEAGIVSKFATPVLQHLVQHLDIEMVDHRKKPVLKERRTTGFSGKINLVSTDYQPYDVAMDIRLKSGENIIKGNFLFSPVNEKIIRCSQWGSQITG